MHARVAITATISLALAASASATEFVQATRPDPFAPGSSCDTPELVSWGSYVYNWPSKYDLVFAPQTDLSWVWRCETSGYVSFADDFAEIDTTDRSKIAAYLKQTNFGPKLKDEPYELSEELLRHLDALYAIRDKDIRFRAYFMRYLAWQSGPKPIADEYRKKAFDLHKQMLEDGWLKSQAELETLYILGFYAHKLGRAEEAKAYFGRLSDAWTIHLDTAHYLRTLAKEVEQGKADDRVRFANKMN